MSARKKTSVCFVCRKTNYYLTKRKILPFRRSFIMRHLKGSPIRMSSFNCGIHPGTSPNTHLTRQTMVIGSIWDVWHLEVIPTELTPTQVAKAMRKTDNFLYGTST